MNPELTREETMVLDAAERYLVERIVPLSVGANAICHWFNKNG